MRTVMARMNAAFELDENGRPPLERQNDTHIMDAILESEKFTASQIRWLNFCRLFLQAVAISDLSEATGLQLDPTKQHGNPSARNSTTKWLHVRQNRPAEEVWKLWRRVNRLWSVPDGVLHRPLAL
jgi:hypothetical protein